MPIDTNNNYAPWLRKYIVENPCPKCGKRVKSILSDWGRTHLVGDAYCDECNKEELEKSVAESREYSKRYPLEDCPSCHGSGTIDGYTCGKCLGEGKIRSSWAHYS